MVEHDLENTISNQENSNQENRGFRKRGKVGIVAGLVGYVASILFGSGCNVAWRDPFTAWRIQHKERKTIGKITEPFDIKFYDEKVKKVKEERKEIVQGLGVMNPDNPDKPNYDALVKKAKEMTVADLDVVPLPYSLKDIQSIYDLIKETREKDSKGYQKHGLDTIEEKIKNTLADYNARLAGETTSSGERKALHYLVGMTIARSLDDRPSFDDFYGLLTQNTTKSDRLFLDTQLIPIAYNDICEDMKTGYRSDNRAANTWWTLLGIGGGYAILEGLGVFDKEDGVSSSGSSGGGEGPGGPAGKGFILRF